MKLRKGFTLIELLVVVAIIALLIAILLPSLGRARAKAKTTQCLGTMRGMGQAMNIYITEFGKLFGADDNTGNSWMQLMQRGGYGTSQKARTCPEAREIPNSGSTALQVGSAHLQWGNAIFGGVGYNSSYGINGFIFNYGGSDLTNALNLYAGSANTDPTFYFSLPGGTGQASIPAFTDSTWRHMFPQPTDPAPTDLENPVPASQSVVGGTSPNPMARLVINRHDKAVNVVFVDAHAETVKLPQLWTLRWHAKWTRTNPQPVK